MKSPLTQCKEEVEEHSLTHLPYRDWCRHCIRGRGREWPHRCVVEEVSLPELHADLCFLGDEAEPGKTLPVRVMRERTSNMMLAAALPSKSTHSCIAKRAVAHMKEIGVVHGDVVVRTDQEPAIMAIAGDIGRVRAAAGGGRYVIEQSLAGRQQRQ